MKTIIHNELYLVRGKLYAIEDTGYKKQGMRYNLVNTDSNCIVSRKNNIDELMLILMECDEK